MQPRDEKIERAITDLIDPRQEPVMWGSVVSSAVIATLNYLEVSGRYVLSNEELGLILIWLNVLALIVRSQFTPYLRR